MIEEFRAYIARHHLFSLRDKLLLACSGGVDSMVLGSLLMEAGYSFGLAHANFQLRKNDAELDQALVEKMGSDLNLPVHVERFETEKYGQSQKISIQMAARELRYAWLEKIRTEFNYQFILTAHHIDDNLETVLLNFAKGTGISGLRGILPKHEKLRRPLLFTTKSAIAEYAKTQEVTYREDASNALLIYERNMIRHNVIPGLREINPNLETTFAQSTQHIREAEQIVKAYLNSQKNKLWELRGNDWYIGIRKMESLPWKRTVLHYLLSPFGFSNSQVHDIINGLGRQPGKEYLTPTHRLIFDRKFLILTSRDALQSGNINISESARKVRLPEFTMHFKKEKWKPHYPIPSDQQVACIDWDLLDFPLTLRRWKVSDYFYPIGLGKTLRPGKRGKKKLSRFFQDIKLNQVEKERIWLLCSGEKVVWVVGHRLDDRFKISSTTAHVLKCRISS